MKKYKDLSVKIKVPVIMGIASFVVLALICVLLMRPLRSYTLEDSAHIARLSAISAGERLGLIIGGSAGRLPGRSNVISNYINLRYIRKENKRRILLEDIVRFVEGDDNPVTNAWLMLEPNFLDGMDSAYINTRGHNSKGAISARYINGKMLVADAPIYNEMYCEAKAERRAVISNPYMGDFYGDGEQVYMISICTPVKSGDDFYGVLGIDFKIDELADEVANLNPIGKGKLVTDKGIVVITYMDSRMGKEAENGNREILDKLPEGKMFEGFWKLQGKMQYKVYVPVQFIKDTAPWFYAVDVPRAIVYKNVRYTTIYLIIYCFIGVLLIALAGWALMQPMLKNIGNVTDTIRKLSLGHINMDMDASDNLDELGVMNNELGRLVEGMKHTTDFANNIGKGKLDAEYSLLSDDDILGNSLLNMQQNLQNSEQFKSSLLANLSHEIRTPLNGIIGLLNILSEDQQLSDTNREYIDLIINSSEQLLNLINDILDSARMEAGKMNIRSEPLDIDAMMNEIQVFFTQDLQRIGKTDVRLESCKDENLDKRVVNTDPVRLRQIINNLLGNAVKFTERGYIRFGYRLLPDAKLLEFYVEDTGSGISESQLELIFQRFRQTEHSRGGTGLGLPISQGLAQLLGGDMQVKSVVGKGSTFSFTISYNPCK
jgi:signal transduction histidine kinase